MWGGFQEEFQKHFYFWANLRKARCGRDGGNMSYLAGSASRQALTFKFFQSFNGMSLWILLCGGHCRVVAVWQLGIMMKHQQGDTPHSQPLSRDAFSSLCCSMKQFKPIYPTHVEYWRSYILIWCAETHDIKSNPSLCVLSSLLFKTFSSKNSSVTFFKKPTVH